MSKILRRSLSLVCMFAFCLLSVPIQAMGISQGILYVSNKDYDIPQIESVIPDKVSQEILENAKAVIIETESIKELNIEQLKSFIKTKPVYLVGDVSINDYLEIFDLPEYYVNIPVFDKDDNNVDNIESYPDEMKEQMFSIVGYSENGKHHMLLKGVNMTPQLIAEYIVEDYTKESVVATRSAILWKVINGVESANGSRKATMNHKIYREITADGSKTHYTIVSEAYFNNNGSSLNLAHAHTQSTGSFIFSKPDSISSASVINLGLGSGGVTAGLSVNVGKSVRITKTQNGGDVNWKYYVNYGTLASGNCLGAASEFVLGKNNTDYLRLSMSGMAGSVSLPYVVEVVTMKGL